MFSFIGVDRYIIYAPDGGEAEALAVGHALSLIRGAVGGNAGAGAGGGRRPRLINMQAYEVSFAMVAAVPLLSGATHLGTAQMQRAGRFWPAAASDAGGAVLGVAAAAIAAVVAPDHRAIIWGLAAQTGGAVVLSHCFARGRRYRISFDHRRIRETLRFGLPLLINGVALAAAYQFDRMIVGAWLGVVALGVYGLCQTLLFQPLALLQRLTTTTLQPGLSRAWHADPEQLFPTQTRHIAMLMAALSCAIAVAAACLGAPALRLLFGASFTASDAFFVLMATALLIRMARGCLNLFGLAIGRTADLMLSNIAGSASLPMMIAAFAVYPRLESAAFAAVVGEVMGCLAAYLRPAAALRPGMPGRRARPWPRRPRRRSLRARGSCLVHSLDLDARHGRDDRLRRRVRCPWYCKCPGFGAGFPYRPVNRRLRNHPSCRVLRGMSGNTAPAISHVDRARA